MGDSTLGRRGNRKCSKGHAWQERSFAFQKFTELFLLKSSREQTLSSDAQPAARHRKEALIYNKVRQNKPSAHVSQTSHHVYSFIAIFDKLICQVFPHCLGPLQTSRCVHKVLYWFPFRWAEPVLKSLLYREKRRFKATAFQKYGVRTKTVAHTAKVREVINDTIKQFAGFCEWWPWIWEPHFDDVPVRRLMAEWIVLFALTEVCEILFNFRR